MAARTSMADLLLALRGLTSAGSAEYTVAGSAYWTDDQLQAVMDRHVYPIRHEALNPQPSIGAGGTVSYFNYQSPRRFWESTSGGTSRFIVQDESGATVGTSAYTVDYPYGRLTFGTDTTGLTRYVTGFSYDMNAAAADIFTQKAAHYVTAYDISTDNHSLSRGQIIDNCLKLAKEYSAGAWSYSVTMERSDTEQFSGWGDRD
jgi:hypothetical protein